MSVRASEPLGLWTRAASIFFGLACALLLAVPAGGLVVQEAAESSAVEPASESSEEEALQQLFPSPRSAFAFFLDSMAADDVDAVLDSGVMDLSVLPPEGRRATGRRLAENLYEIINRTEYVDLESVPTQGHYSLEKNLSWDWVQSPPKRPSVNIRINFHRSSVEQRHWRISGTTVTSIDAMWNEVKDLLPLAEVRERQPFSLKELRYSLLERLPSVLREEAFLLENWQWAILGLLLFIGVVFDRIARFLVGVSVRRLAGINNPSAEEVLKFGRPIGILCGALLFQQLLPVVGLEENLRRILEVASGVLVVTGGVWGVYRLVDVFCGFLAKRAVTTANKFDDMFVPLLRRTLKIFVTVVGLLYLASLWSDDFWGVIAGLSFGAMAVGFAAKDSFENLFGTFTVLLDKPFQLGDWIQTGEYEGTVEEVGFRSTRIRTFYDSRVSMPNRHFISGTVDNLGLRRYRRIRTTLSLTYSTPPAKIEAFCEGVREIVRTHPFTRKDYYHVYLNSFGPASLDVLLYVFLRCPDWGTELREKQRLFLDILSLAERLEVEFAFPTQTLHVYQEEHKQRRPAPDSNRAGTRLGREVGAAVGAENLEHAAGGHVRPVSFDSDYIDYQVADTDGGE